MNGWTVDGDASTFAPLAASEDPIGWLEARAGQVHRDLPSRRTFDLTVDGRRYVAKVHYGVGVREVLRTLPRGQLPVFDAGVEHRALLCAAQAGVRVPVPRVLGLRQGPALSRQSFLVMDAVEYEVTVADELAQGSSALRRARRLRQVAELTRRLHASGLQHRDLYLVHFLVCEDDELCLIDLHRARHHAQLPETARIRELGALTFSAPGLTAAERRRFVVHYGDADRARDQRFWQRVEARAARLTRRGARG